MFRATIACVGVALFASTARGQPGSLDDGLQKDGIQQTLKALKEKPAHVANTAQFQSELGLCEFLNNNEALLQDLYRYGLRPHGDLLRFLLPGFRIPVPENPLPRRIGYEDTRAMVVRYRDGLRRAQAALDRVDGDMLIPLHVGLIKLNIDGNKELDESETAYLLFANMVQTEVQLSDASAFRISFDRADVEWLKGYCHLLQGFCEIALAYDWRDCFERAGHLFFAETITPYPFILTPSPGMSYAGIDFRDVIALFHSLRFRLIDPAGMKKALDHFQTVIKCSRKMWKLVRAETDDDHEWIPSPTQTGAIPSIQFTEQMMKAWHAALRECEAILEGKKLIQFWRHSSDGVNLRKVFTEPRDIDVLLWIQGTAAVPYLEAGDISPASRWENISIVFGRNLIFFSFWIN